MDKKENLSLKEIEMLYDTQSILLGDDFVWPIVRFKINEEIRKRSGLGSRTFKLDRKKLFKLLKTFFYGFLNLFRLRHYDYWIFSSSDRRKKMDAKYMDRVIEPLAAENKKSLLIENPFPLGGHYPKNWINQCNIISQTPFYAGIKLVSLLSRKRLKIKNEALIQKILKDNNIEIDYNKLLKNHIAQYRFIKFLMRFGKPKAVFMVYAASSMGYIKAFKEKGIPVIEVQHGIINASHYAYNVYKDFGKILFPDYLMTYGKYELDIFNDKNYFIAPSNVFPVGYFFLEKFRNSMDQDLDKKKFYGEFDKIIAFSLQDPFEKYVFEFLDKLAALDTSILYLAVPRDPLKPYLNAPKRKNLIIERNRNIYECLQIADFHATINSTCAIEALYFGVPNILFDYSNWASDYYNKILNDAKHTVFVKSPDEFLDMVRSHMFDETDMIVESSKYFIEQGFEQNVKNLMKDRIFTNRDE